MPALNALNAFELFPKWKQLPEEPRSGGFSRVMAADVPEAVEDSPKSLNPSSSVGISPFCPRV